VALKDPPDCQSFEKHRSQRPTERSRDQRQRPPTSPGCERSTRRQFGPEQNYQSHNADNQTNDAAKRNVDDRQESAHPTLETKAQWKQLAAGIPEGTYCSA